MRLSFPLISPNFLLCPFCRIMTTYTNHKLIGKHVTRAKRISFVGLGVLLVGLAITLPGLFNPAQQSEWYLLGSYCALILGTIISTIGMRYTEKWFIKPRNDQRLDKAVRGLDQRYRLVNYYTSTEHVLLTPTGLYVLVVKDETGRIRFDGKRWSQPFSLLRLWRDFRHGGLGDPTLEVGAEIEKLQKWLKPKGEGVDAPIKPVVVFSKPEAELDIAGEHDYIMPIKNLRNYLVRQTAEPLAAALYQALADAVIPQDATEAAADDEAEAEAHHKKEPPKKEPVKKEPPKKATAQKSSWLTKATQSKPAKPKTAATAEEPRVKRLKKKRRQTTWKSESSKEKTE